jgi:hypothetical protein
MSQGGITKCGINGADVRPDWTQNLKTESLTRSQWRIWWQHPDGRFGGGRSDLD